MEKILMNWSGGKDSAMALHLLQQNKNIEVISLLTSVNKEMQRISMHGVHIDLLKKQADCIGLPLQLLQVPESTQMEVYEKAMEEQLSHFSKLGVRTSAFGDILLEDLREYREKQLAKIGWKAKFPLWQKDTQKLVHDFIEMGFKTRVCCINKEFLGTEFLGRDIDEDFINDLPKNVDPCGENGEFHTFVYDGPIFREPLNISNGEKIEKSYSHDGKSYGFEFIDLK